MMKSISKVSSLEILKIIETREPKGLFYHYDNKTYLGCDNLTGEAWLEEFETEEKCKHWLLNENLENESFKYRVFCDMTHYEFFTNDFNEAKSKALNFECSVYDNITNKVLFETI